jgi:hypothetical protein
VNSVFTALGLSASSGLNTYLPLLIAAAFARGTNYLHFREPFGFLTSWWMIALLALLVGVELVADKIPGADHFNDLVNTPLRPAAGGLLFAATANGIADWNVIVAALIGVALAGGVHAVKATSRPIVTASTGGIGNPMISLVEDGLAGVAAVLAIVVPIFGIPLVIIFVVAVFFGVRRIRGRQLFQWGGRTHG